MTQKKGLLIDIGVAIIVFMIATIALGVVHNRNVATGTDLPWAEIYTQILSHNPEQQNQIYLFDNHEELQTQFASVQPNPNRINWETHKMLAFVGDTITTMDYGKSITSGQIQGQIATIKYQFSFSDIKNNIPEGSQIAEGYPVLLMGIDREDLAHHNQITFRFQNSVTNETHSLYFILKNETPANN